MFYDNLKNGSTGLNTLVVISIQSGLASQLTMRVDLTDPIFR